ncbi:hypothetical protein [Ponticaulis sp.]|jgi:hypothetical protein|uniref:hypothetical protein n=1 Tax=Ponticaulis sp. TaxID=2020902 RepID=UPI0025CF3155|nr:hypothetical protein [Ponticaulis sp.]|tara:strand:+ start:728 stop:901 length:174 start_codon:yes stop_codon:yes gene_type:complete
MEDIRVLDELNILTTCQKVISDLLGAAPDGHCSTHQLALLMGYIASQQEKLIEQIGK